MRNTKLAWLVSCWSMIALTRCECDPELQRVAPKIEIADAFDASISVCEENGVRACTYNFGEVVIGEGRFVKLLIKNPSPVDLYVNNIEYDVSSDPAFGYTVKREGQDSENDWPVIVRASSGEGGTELTLGFIPTVSSEVQGRLVIRSDAANLEPGEDVVIELRGTGVDLGRPELVISPEECDFGRVGVGVTAFCDLTLENQGERDLSIDTVGFSPNTPTDIFGAASVLAVPIYVAPGTGISVRLYAAPARVEESSGAVVLTTNDPLRPSAEIPLKVEGAMAPTAVARVQSINGSPNQEAAPLVQPLDDVVLTGVDSVAAEAGGQIVAYQWELIEKPVESSVTLTTPNQMTTQFSFSNGFNASGIVNGLDVAGTFVVRLTVTDDYGAVSTNDARVTLNSVPGEALHVQLTWDAPVNDLDFHLRKGPNANYCGNSGCYYANCKASFASHLEWDGVAGRSAGDPSLDVDDLSGYGPENINIDAPSDDTYTVGVHFYSGSQATIATVKIFVNGALRDEYAREITSSKDFWEVAQVQWQNGSAVVTPVDDYSSSFSCN